MLVEILRDFLSQILRPQNGIQFSQWGILADFVQNIVKMMFKKRVQEKCTKIRGPKNGAKNGPKIRDFNQSVSQELKENASSDVGTQRKFKIYLHRLDG